MKRILLALSVLTAALFLTSCEGKREETADYQIYYVNKEGTKLVSRDLGAAAKEMEASEEELSENAAMTMAEEFLKQMNENPKNADVRPAKPENVSVLQYVLEDGFLYMDFNTEYFSMDAVTEVLYRAAVVKTLTQIPGIEGVSFQIAGAPLTDGKGNAVGIMTADSFVDHTGETINAYNRDSLNLYFASGDGKFLRRKQVDVVYNGNVSMEKLVMEQLIRGPQSEDCKAVLPSDVTVLNISVTEGTCYVNFDEKIQGVSSDITEDVLLYSIVNSLTELSTIQRVQISINGKTDRMLREGRSLDQAYEQNLELVEHGQE